MTLSSALSIANSGLANINTQFAVLSQNIANASTPGYAAEVGTQQAISAGGVSLGVRTGPTVLQVDNALQGSIVQQNAVVAGSKTTQASLQAIDGVLGSPGSGSDLGSLVGNLQDSFSTLLTEPGNQAQQSAVVTAASTLAQGINGLSAAYTAQRQAAQNDLQSAVSTVNATLQTIGSLNGQAVQLKSSGQDTADVENQRNQAVQTLSSLLRIRTVEQPNGDLSVFTPSGVVLPTDGTANPFSIEAASASPGAYYPNGGLPGIMLNGKDVTGQMTGGQIGADLTLRDQTLPTGQAELDEFASGVANRFAAQGLTLFSDGVGNVPAGGGTPAQANYVGFAARIQVNPAVTADPALVRDGTGAVAADPAGASAFTPNPGTGPAGFTTLINRVLNYTFGNQAQDGVTQPAMATTGLGPSGALAAPFGGSNATLSDYATSLVTAQAQQSAAATGDLTTEQALQTSLTSRQAAVSGVNMDTEMSNMLMLQNAYGVNARIISTLQSMFNQLLQVVQ